MTYDIINITLKVLTAQYLLFMCSDANLFCCEIHHKIIIRRHGIKFISVLNEENACKHENHFLFNLHFPCIFYNNHFSHLTEPSVQFKQRKLIAFKVADDREETSQSAQTHNSNDLVTYC